MQIKRSIAKRIQRVFLIFALSISLFFSLLILGYSWIIEDNIFNRLVASEASLIEAHYRETGDVLKPRSEYMTLYTSWLDLPEAIRHQRQIDPTRIEFSHGSAGTIHIREIVLGSEKVILAANVAEYEVSRDYLPLVSLWLLLGIFLTCLLALGIAALIARSAILPLRNLTQAVAAVGHRDIEPGFAKAYAEDEVGFLAKTIETGVVRLQSVLRRETDFTRDVSHELRTPTAVLALLAEELERDGALKPQSGVLFKQTVNQLDQTIATLLALARQENIALREMPLLPLLEESIINHYQLARNQDFQLEIDVPLSITVTCNQNLAHILIDNLLTNAIRYAAEPWLNIKADSQSLTFENALNYNAPSVSKGLGLGLGLVKRVCERFAWQVHVEQEATLFRIKIAFAAERVAS